MNTWLKDVSLYAKYLKLRVENRRMKRYRTRQFKHIRYQCRIMEVRALQLDKMSYHRKAHAVREDLKNYIEQVRSDYQLGRLSTFMQWWTAHVAFKFFRKIKPFKQS